MMSESCVCSICLATPEVNTIRPCMESREHVFCKGCFQDWVESLRYKNVYCPCCRTGISEEVWRESVCRNGPVTTYSTKRPEKVIARETYEEGFLHGLQFYYHEHWGPEELLREVIEYRRGKKTGVYQVYEIAMTLRKGVSKCIPKLVKEGTLLNGNLCGEYREWFLTGKVKKIYYYKHGFMDGVCEDYNGRGVLKSSKKYVMGIPQR